MSLVKMLMLLALSAIFLVVILQNTEVVTLKLFVWEVSMSQIVLLPLVLVAGLAIGFVLGRWRRHVR